MPNSFKIQKISSHKIINSRGEWTIATKVTLDDGSVGVQTVPDGASKGEHEAMTIPPTKAVELLYTVVSDHLLGEELESIKNLDDRLIELDGTANKSNLGANTILSVSLAAARAHARSQKMDLYEYIAEIFNNSDVKTGDLKFPTPVFNILNGGKHATNNLTFQEFMVIPSPTLAYEESVSIGLKIYHELKKELKSSGKETGVGDEGGFAPTGYNPESALAALKKAASKNYTVGKDVFFGMDVASGSFYDSGEYVISELNKRLHISQLRDYYADLVSKYELIYIEDPYYENDLEGWKLFYKDFHNKLMVVGDDLVVTNPSLLNKYSGEKMLNAVIVKPNQIGTLSETLEFIKVAKSNKMNVIVSHRSGDTAEDTFISDLAVGTSADFIKSGAPARGERVAKYNRLLDIYEIYKSKK